MINKEIKNIIIFITIILVIFGVLINANKKNNKLYISDKNIIILNDTHYNVELKTKLILNKIFDYDSMYIKYAYMDEQVYIGNIQLSAYIVKNTFFKNQYVIYMSKNIKPYHEDIVLSHELLHLKQYETCKLEIINPFSKILIYNKDTLNLNNITYYERPFEIDAYNTQDSIYNMLQILLNNDPK